MAASITAFVDDSKDATQERFVISAAVVGLKTGWNAFNKEWAKTLRRNPSITHFHATDWRGLKGEFRQFRENGHITDKALMDADSKRNDLLEVIRAPSVTAVSVAVDVQAWKRVVEEHPKRVVIEVNPYKLALQELVYIIAKDAQAGRHKINFVCDQDNQAKVYHQVYRNFRKANPQTAKKIASTLTFASDDATYGIQAADLVAHTINKIHQQYGMQARDLPQPPELVGLMSRVHIWDYAYGMATLDAQTL